MPRRSSASTNNTTTAAAPVATPRRSVILSSRASQVLRTLGNVLTWSFGLCLLGGLLWGTASLEQYVITDERFRLAGPPEPGIPDDHFVIEGAVHASEQQITNVFLRDFGRSVYMCPISERRRRLLGIDWVQDATVSRIWPNRLIVRVKERIPVAFVQVPAADQSMTYGLVDTEGVMLDPQRASRLALPVISGMPMTEPEARRRERVKRFLRMQGELGSWMSQISETDVSDIRNMKVVSVTEGTAVTLMLGDQLFLQRFQNFTNNNVEIRKRLPQATVLDLRLKDRITAVEMAAPAQPVAGRKKEVRK